MQSEQMWNKCEDVIQCKFIPSVIDASTISNNMTSDEFPWVSYVYLCHTTTRLLSFQAQALRGKDIDGGVEIS